jgi:simple sugar transport system permease protein
MPDLRAWYERAYAPLLALAIAWLVGNLLVLAWGENPASIWGLLLSGTWGSAYGIGQVLFKATPLALTGFSVAVAFRAGLFNVGAEGQLAGGSLACAVVGASLPSGTPFIVAIPLCAVAAMATGAALGGTAGYLRARFGAHEVITTIMLNFIVAAIVGWLLTEYLAMPETLHTAPVVEGAEIPRLDAVIPALHGSASSWAILLVPLVAVFVTWLLARTRVGLEIRSVGLSPDAAHANGVPVARTRTIAMALAGALAGLPALSNVLGYKHVFEQGFGAGAGFMGIAVALLGQGRAAGIVLASLLFATLSQGGLVINARVPKDLINVLEAAVIIGIIATTGALRGVIGTTAAKKAKKEAKA